MLRVKEYISQIEISKYDADKMESAQISIRDDGFKYANKDALVSNLNRATTILSLVWMLPTPVTLAAGVVSLISAYPSQRSMCISEANRGIVGISNVQAYFTNNPSIKRVRVKFPFMEFSDTAGRFRTHRIVNGNGLITGVFDGNMWH